MWCDGRSAELLMVQREGRSAAGPEGGRIDASEEEVCHKEGGWMEFDV